MTQSEVEALGEKIYKMVTAAIPTDIPSDQARALAEGLIEDLGYFIDGLK